jgi:hypothetical protein
VPQQRLPAQIQVLLGALDAHAAAATGGGNDGEVSGHAQILLDVKNWIAIIFSEYAPHCSVVPAKAGT